MQLIKQVDQLLISCMSHGFNSITHIIIIQLIEEYKLKFIHNYSKPLASHRQNQYRVKYHENLWQRQQAYLF